MDFEAFHAFHFLLGCWSLAYSVCHETLSDSLPSFSGQAATLISDRHSVANWFLKDVIPLYLWASDGPFPLQELNNPLPEASHKLNF